MADGPVVLVAEDEWFLRACIASYLRAANWRVLETRTGEAAISLLQAGQHIDVLFTDIGLAGKMSGWEVGERFRRAEPEIPVIYTSGDAPQLERAVANSLFIAKPYDLDAIVDACRTVANGRSDPRRSRMGSR